MAWASSAEGLAEPGDFGDGARGEAEVFGVELELEPVFVGHAGARRITRPGHGTQDPSIG